MSVPEPRELSAAQRARAILEAPDGPERVGEVLRLLEGAAEAGDAEAALALARLLLESGAADDAGVYWLAQAAHAGLAPARRELARAVLAGRGLPEPDPVEAVRLLREAGEAGDDDATRDLVELLCALDPEMLFEAAVWVADADDGFRWTLHAAIAEAAPGWFGDNGLVLATALGLD